LRRVIFNQFVFDRGVDYGPKSGDRKSDSVFNKASRAKFRKESLYLLSGYVGDLARAKLWQDGRNAN
jgi:hypothetical protein